MTSLSLRDLCKSFGSVDVIQDVDLDIDSGDFVVFVGPSGSGKSTLLRMIAGLEDISGGSLQIGERLVNNVAPAERGVAMVFQSYALYPHLTVRENIGFGLKVRKVPKDQIALKVADAAANLKLVDYLDRYPKELSGGQRQRVAIGRAIVGEPNVFLFDEPLSNLDAELRVHMRTEIAALHEKLGNTMVYVTHDQVEAMTLADKIVVLKSGKIEQYGTPKELYAHPNSLFVAQFIGSPKMNVFAPLALGNRTSIADNVVKLGIRPEHLRVSDNGLFSGKLKLCEYVGAGSLLHVDVPDVGVFLVQIHGQETPTIGTPIKLEFDLDDLHYFDAEDQAVHLH